MSLKPAIGDNQRKEPGGLRNRLRNWRLLDVMKIEDMGHIRGGPKEEYENRIRAHRGCWESCMMSVGLSGLVSLDILSDCPYLPKPWSGG